jgi:hypothetical protein
MEMYLYVWLPIAYKLDCVMSLVFLPHRYCFVENLVQEGLMPTCEFVVLDEWFKWITTHLNTGGDLIGKYEYRKTQENK